MHSFYFFLIVISHIKIVFDLYETIAMTNEAQVAACRHNIDIDLSLIHI